ncbi:MAG: hypothetical protein MUF22_07820 [Chitinispirillaceae bacterium]|nr:hypothetical protein [Chitinispirillaceae bacterium]
MRKQDVSDFSKVKISDKFGVAQLSGIPRPVFMLLWAAIQMASLPYKIRKAFNLVAAFILSIKNKT